MPNSMRNAMPNVLSQIKATLQPHLSTASQIVVAYSGGLDSTVLLHGVAQLYLAGSIPVVAIHVNHNLSDNANDWQTHCQNVCQRLGVTFIARSVQITSNEKGLEAQARALRYEAIANSIKPQALVLTGQHQQDQVETFLLQLKRGAGPKGLSAMAQSSGFANQSALLRPLLNCPRKRLEAYALSHQLGWVEDESNLDTRFERNFFRQQVLPTIAERWPGFDKAACRSIALIAEQQQLVDEMAAEDLAQAQTGQWLAIPGIVALSNIRQRNLLRFWFTSQGVELPSAVVLNNMINELILAKPDANPKVQWAGYQLRRFDQRIYLLNQSIENPGEACSLTLNQPLVFNHSIGSLLLDDISAELPISALQIRAPADDEHISVRFNVSGLSCRVLGNTHHKKLRQLFKENKIPPWQRSRTPLIYYNEQLACVGGLFICEGFAPEQGKAVSVRFDSGDRP
jgi:tRNA(Ile)-lysidine synthase